MDWNELLRWLVSTVGVGTVAGAVYWSLNEIKARLDSRPVLWSRIRYGNTNQRSILFLTARNRSSDDLVIEAVAILRPPGLTINQIVSLSEDPHFKDVSLPVVPVQEAVEPCPPFAAEYPSKQLEWDLTGLQSPPEPVRLRVTILRMARGRTKRKTIEITPSFGPWP